MKFHGIQLEEGSRIKNATVDSGSVLPNDPSTGELFYLNTNDSNEGLYIYNDSAWVPAVEDLSNYARLDQDETVTGEWTHNNVLHVDSLDVTGINSIPNGLALTDVDTLGIFTAGVQQVTITPTGELGIGTVPATPLHIERNQADVTIVYLANSDSDPNAAAAYYAGNGNALAVLGMSGTDSSQVIGPNAAFIDGSGESGLVLTASNPGGYIRFRTTSTEKMRLANNGDFGIGTDSPAYKLDVAGIIRTSSGIIFPDAQTQTIAFLGAASQITSGTFADARISQSSVTQHQASLTILESQITDGALLARVGGSETITGTWSFNNTVTGVDPVSASHFATKQYVDNLYTGLDFKQSVRAATTANISLSGPQTIDGVSIIAGNRVLVKNQNTPADNGIYVAAAGTWARSTDADGSPVNEVSSGMYMFVEEGTTNADTGWILSTDDPITLGTTALTFVQFTGLGQITAGAGLTKTGSVIDIGTASSSRIVVNADTIDLATVSNAGTGTFSKLTVDSYGRVTGTTAVVASDITDLVDATYVNVTGDTMTGQFILNNVPGNQMFLTSGTSSGAIQTAIRINHTTSPTATTRGEGVFVSTTIGDGSTTFTLPEFSSYRATNTIAASATVTDYYGVRVEAPTVTGTITNLYGIRSQIVSGANRWNIYADGTAANYFGGNVGVGIVSAGSRLHVANTTLSGGILTFTGNNNFTHTFTSETTSNSVAGAKLLLTTASASGEFSYANSGGELFRIDRLGNVGIGQAPGAKLDVTGTIRTYTAAPQIVSYETDAATDEKNYRIAQYAGKLNWELVNDADSNSYKFLEVDRTGISIDYVAFSTGANVERLRIDSSGNTYPGSNATQTLGTSSARWSTVFATSLSDGADQLVGSSGSTSRFGYGAGWTALSMATGGSERLRIDSSGNILINGSTQIRSGKVVVVGDGSAVNHLVLADSRAYSTTPLAQLDFAVQYNAAGTYADIAAVRGAKANSTDGSQLGILQFYVNTGSGAVENMRLDSSGNLSLAPAAGASAAHRLHIQGSATGATAGRGVRVTTTVLSDVTGSFWAFDSTVATANATFTTGDVGALIISNVSKGASHTINNQYGILISDLSAGGNNYGIYSSISTGANKWNLYLTGTAANFINGDITVGTSTQATYSRLTINGNNNSIALGRIGTGGYGELTSNSTLGLVLRSNTYYDGVSAKASTTGYSPEIDLRIDTGVITFNTSTSVAGNASVVMTERVRIDASGNLLVVSSGGLGYGTGSGGTVTQATSRTTGVTLNKTNGAITLFSATATAASYTTFTLTNSTISATDTVIVNVKTSTGLYIPTITQVAAGSCNITLYSPNLVGAAESPVLNFAVIKAVTA